MPRRLSCREKEIFSKFVNAHPHVEQSGLSQEEYEKVCNDLNWDSTAVKKQKYVNITNVDRLLLEYKQMKNRTMEKIVDPDNIIDQPEDTSSYNENCSCTVCIARYNWDGKRLYKFSEHTFEKQRYVVKFNPEEWKKFSSVDNKGKYMLSGGYGGIVTREMRVSDCSCKDVATKTNFGLASNGIQILAYCTWGNENPCNLFKLIYNVLTLDKVCNPDDGSKIFEVFATNYPTKHCANSYKVPQLRGQNRHDAKNDIRKQMPKAYGNYLVVNYGDRHYVTPKNKWPLSQNTIAKIRTEVLNETSLSESRNDTLTLMWACESQMP